MIWDLFLGSHWKLRTHGLCLRGLTWKRLTSWTERGGGFHPSASWYVSVLQTYFYFCTTFPLLFCTSIFYRHLWRQTWLFHFTTENISPRIQVWRTMMAGAELCDAQLSFDLIIECIWNIWSDSWIVSRDRAGCLTQSYDLSPWLPSLAFLHEEKAQLYARTKDKSINCWADFIQNISPLIQKRTILISICKREIKKHIKEKVYFLCFTKLSFRTDRLP